MVKLIGYQAGFGFNANGPVRTFACPSYRAAVTLRSQIERDVPRYVSKIVEG